MESREGITTLPDIDMDPKSMDSYRFGTTELNKFFRNVLDTENSIEEIDIQSQAPNTNQLNTVGSDTQWTEQNTPSGFQAWLSEWAIDFDCKFSHNAGADNITPATNVAPTRVFSLFDQAENELRGQVVQRINNLPKVWGALGQLLFPKSALRDNENYFLHDDLATTSVLGARDLQLRNDGYLAITEEKKAGAADTLASMNGKSYVATTGAAAAYVVAWAGQEANDELKLTVKSFADRTADQSPQAQRRWNMFGLESVAGSKNRYTIRVPMWYFCPWILSCGKNCILPIKDVGLSIRRASAEQWILGGDASSCVIQSAILRKVYVKFKPLAQEEFLNNVFSKPLVIPHLHPEYRIKNLANGASEHNETISRQNLQYWCFWFNDAAAGSDPYKYKLQHTYDIDTPANNTSITVKSSYDGREFVDDKEQKVFDGTKGDCSIAYHNYWKACLLNGLKTDLAISRQDMLYRRPLFVFHVPKQPDHTPIHFFERPKRTLIEDIQWSVATPDANQRLNRMYLEQSYIILNARDQDVKAIGGKSAN